MQFSYLTVYRKKITLTYKNLRLDTGFKCTPRNFSKKKQEILPSSNLKNREFINQELKKQKRKIDDLIIYCHKTYGEVEVDRLKKLIKNPPEARQEEVTDMIALLGEFIEVKGHTKTNKIHNLRMHISRYLDGETIKPDQVDLYFLNGLESLLRETNGSNSVKKYFNVLKGFFNYLERYKGYPVNIAVRDKKIMGEEPFFVVLTDQQVDDLREYIPDSKPKERIKDIFLILILTGMSWTDYVNCTIDHDIKVIHGFRQKTRTPFKVPLHPEVIVILAKYRHIKPLVAAPVFNRSLKSLLSNIPSYCFTKKKRGKSKPFYELVTSHTGRHTFIDRGLRRNFPIQQLMTYVGHKSPNQLLEYAKKHLTTSADFELINQL